jgi:hypothetical protein
MDKKFDKIYEGVVTRFQGGGVLPGDVVKFTDDATSNEWLKAQNETMGAKIAELMASDNILRVSAVKTIRPTVAGGLSTNQASDEFFADVVKEISPGLFTDVITVPVNVIVVQDTEHGVVPFPDSSVIDNPTDAETKVPEVKADDDMLHPPHQTKTDDDERKLSNKNVPGKGGAEDHMGTSVYLGGLR